MTEAEWLTSADPRPMLAYLGHRPSDRKLRLFGVYCCRYLIRVLDDRGRSALEKAERYAEGLCGRDVLEAARLGAQAAFNEFNDSTPYGLGDERGWESAADAVERLCRCDGFRDEMDEIAVESAVVQSRLDHRDT